MLDRMSPHEKQMISIIEIIGLGLCVFGCTAYGYYQAQINKD